MWFCVLEFEVCQRVSLCCCGSIFVFDSLRFTRWLVCDVGLFFGFLEFDVFQRSGLCDCGSIFEF
jgi:hypothetical protein